MTSELKSATARANGAKSRGPKTAATREISSRNSLGHGFTCRKIVLIECEDEAEYEQMIAEFVATYNPATEAQKNMVDEMAACRWRLDRFMAAEVGLVDDEMDRMRSLPNCSPDPGICFSRAIRSLADNSNSLSLTRRYLATLNHAFHKAYRVLRELQAEAEAKSARQPAPTAPIQPEPPQPIPVHDIHPAPQLQPTPNPTVELKPQLTPLPTPRPASQRLRNEPTGQAAAALRRRWLSTFGAENARRRRAA